MTTETIKRFDELIERLNATKGTNAKIEILKQHAELEPLIRRIWDPTTKTHVTKRGLETWRAKHDTPGVAKHETLYELLDALTQGAVTGDAAKAAVWAFIELRPRYEDLILRIAEKNPRIRLGETMLLKAFPGMFRIFRVCLSQEYSEVDFERAIATYKRAWISKKIDGMRLITMITAVAGRPEIRFYSRKGHEVTSLAILRRDLLRDLVPHLDAEELREGRVLDGEVVALNPDGTENFKLTISEARRKDREMPNPQYMIFDIMPLPVFEERAPGEAFGTRLESLRDFAEVLPRRCHILEQTPWSEAAFARLTKRAKREQWEGVMIRMDARYEAKRTRNLLKYKFVQTEEYPVVRVVIDPDYPVANKRGGEDRVRALSSVIIAHKKCEVHVGSGFDLEERLEFARSPEKIEGHIISVKFQEEFFDDKKNSWSLRCPIYQGIVGDQERDV